MALPSGGVRDELGELLLDGDVVLEGHVGHLDVLGAPLVEQLDVHPGLLGDHLHGLLGPRLRLGSPIINLSHVFFCKQIHKLKILLFNLRNRI